MYALFDKSDEHHKTAIDFMRRTRSQLVTNLPVITEVVHLYRKSPKIRIEFLRWVTAYVEIDQSTASEMDRIIVILEKYNDLRPDFADASLVALGQRLGTRRIATFDSDFEVYRTISNETFEYVIGK